MMKINIDKEKIKIIKNIVKSREIEIISYILDKTDLETNLFIGTYRKIKTDLQTSQVTIANTMKKLQEKGYIELVQNGVWRVNFK